MTDSTSAPSTSLGILGAKSMVGTHVISRISKITKKTIAFSRNAPPPANSEIEWRQLPAESQSSDTDVDPIPDWICVAPIWVLPKYFPMLENHRVRRIVALSSTSRFTKDTSTDTHEQAIARQLADAEDSLQVWAEGRDVEWVVLRPTLIYDQGRDKNISEIAGFIRRFGFFPLFGAAQGKRQPIHAEDVAAACLSALHSPKATNRAYNISGGETLTYRNMVSRIFAMLGVPSRLLTVPLWAFSMAVALMRQVPRYSTWSSAMAERMNRDMVFDHSEATRDFEFTPRKFVLVPATVSIAKAPQRAS